MSGKGYKRKGRFTRSKSWLREVKEKKKELEKVKDE